MRELDGNFGVEIASGDFAQDAAIVLGLGACFLAIGDVFA